MQPLHVDAFEVDSPNVKYRCRRPCARARASRLREWFVQCNSPTCAASCAARSTSSPRTTTRRPTCRCAVARRCARAIDSSHHAPCHPHHPRGRRRHTLRHRARHRRPRHPHALRCAPFASNLRTPPTPAPPRTRHAACRRLRLRRPRRHLPCRHRRLTRTLTLTQVAVRKTIEYQFRTQVTP